jgi:hypothetical protein
MCMRARLFVLYLEGQEGGRKDVSTGRLCVTVRSHRRNDQCLFSRREMIRQVSIFAYCFLLSNIHRGRKSFDTTLSSTSITKCSITKKIRLKYVLTMDLRHISKDDKHRQVMPFSEGGKDTVLETFQPSSRVLAPSTRSGRKTS